LIVLLLSTNNVTTVTICLEMVVHQTVPGNVEMVASMETKNVTSGLEIPMQPTQMHLPETFVALTVASLIVATVLLTQH